MDKNNFGMVAVTFLVIWPVALVTPLDQKIKLGLDLREVLVL